MEINKIYNEDCYTFLPKLLDKSIDLVLVDVPYELEMNGGCSPQSDFANRKLIKDKHLKFIADGFNYDLVFNEFERVCKKINLLIFCSNKQIAKIMTYWESKGCSATLLVWIKPNPIPLANLKHILCEKSIVNHYDQSKTLNLLPKDKYHEYTIGQVRLYDKKKEKKDIKNKLGVAYNLFTGFELLFCSKSNYSVVALYSQ
jgi:DNA modification methylase